ncbi:DNA polymeras-like protein alpha/primase associated subunit [Periconia macrospinosa]|uniref:DNA polymerase alpha subunit B n=1 Tax=Periconia macrospinosa TaxID=97972 RepID=A0A2V1DNC8_9PLEO|nr:DNA polymeras-like protein alpha/primase associated subunit [Periconia macrospinosa]
MDESTTELTERFERYCNTKDNALPPEVLTELQLMLNLYSVSPEELDFKWQAYMMKLGGEENKMDLKTVRDFKKVTQDTLERESRGKAQQQKNEARKVAPTPRAAKGGDMYDMLDGMIQTPRPGGLNGANGSAAKRRSNFDTPASKANKSHVMSSPGGFATPKTEVQDGKVFNFSTRENAGDITEQLNGHIALPEPPEEEEYPTESRIKLKANTDMSKFSYKTMAMKLSEASEVLDDRIDEFRQLIQDHLKLEDSAFGNPSYQSPSEIIAVGRICSDTSEGKLNTASLVLEGSRRWGSGRRVPLKVEGLPSYNFFPGQIVALRGTNASGDTFVVSEILSLPLLTQPATTPADLDTHNARYLDSAESDPSNVRPLQVYVASGPYTTDQNLDFAPLETLLDNAATAKADAVVLFGPFLDAEHPSIRSGDFDVPAHLTNPDQATMTDIFRHYISSAIQSLTARAPKCNIILVPSLRDAHHHHASFPQDKFLKRELGLGPAGKMVQCVTNPMTLSMNEFIVGMSSIDILDMLRREEITGGKAKAINPYERGARNVIEQRSFLPLFPPTAREKFGAPAAVEEKVYKEGGEEKEDEQGPSPFLPLGTMIDTSYLKLGEMLNVRPDILITPSVLQGCVKVVESVLVINPGTLSKRRAAGTYARLVIQPASLSDEEREKGSAVANKLWERTRVDIVKI